MTDANLSRMTGADLLSLTERSLKCPHGSEVAKWEATQGPCTMCVHEVLLKMTVCHVAGHGVLHDRGCLVEQSHGEQAHASRTVYECSRCGVLFT